MLTTFLGNVVRATDANGVNIINEYDKAGRVIRRCYTKLEVTLASSVVLCSDIPTGDHSLDTSTVENFYDGKGLDAEQSPNYAKGKLTKVTNTISQTLYRKFDNLGRLEETEQTTPIGETIETARANNRTYVSKYKYNFTGALIEEEYPSGRRVKNEFESDGDLSRIYGTANPTATERTYANSFTYTPDGRIERLRLGNGLWEAAKFNTRLQVTELAVGNGVTSGDLWKLGYEYGELNTDGTVNTAKNTGNIAKQTLSFNGLAQPFVQAYKYDSLYRLTEAKETQNGTQTWKQVFDYDRYGNRLVHNKFIGADQVTQSAVTHPSIDPSDNRISSPGYVFDKNGNLTTDGESRSFVFNADNKQREVRDASNNLVGEGRRVKKKTYVGGVFDEETVFVYSNGKLIAEYSNKPPSSTPTTSFTITDQLGSPRVLVNSLGEVVSRRDFMPFGEEVEPDEAHRTANLKYNDGDNIRQKFTGYQKDEETKLDFAEARMYENRHGRFTAIDPLLASGKSANPQTFNRYVYVLNNPLAYTDPDGLQVASVPGGRWYQPTHPDGIKTYRFESTQPEGYDPVTERNGKNELIGTFAGGMVGDERYQVLRFDERGPLKSSPIVDVRTNRTEMYRLTEEERNGFSVIRGPDFKWTGAVQDVSIETVFAAQGVFSLARAGVSARFARGGDTMLLRTMKISEDGLPAPGQSMTTLGARVPRDIAPSEAGIVAPGTGGLSVTPAGGTLPAVAGKNLRTFCISCRELGPNLRYRPDPMDPLNHGFVEPARQMSIEAYQEALLQTRSFWRSLD